MSAMIMVTATTATTKLVPRFGPRPLVSTGMALASVAMALLAQLDVDSTYAAHVLPALLVMGVGLGLIFAPAMSTATLGVAPTDAGRRLGDGQHEPAGRRLDRDRRAEHDLHAAP